MNRLQHDKHRRGAAAQLVSRDLDTVFGIPGVHTNKLYRGLAASGIRHVTPQHEQGARFMANGYARAYGKPGVDFVVTGPIDVEVTTQTMCYASGVI